MVNKMNIFVMVSFGDVRVYPAETENQLKLLWNELKACIESESYGNNDLGEAISEVEKHLANPGQYKNPPKAFRSVIRNFLIDLGDGWDSFDTGTGFDVMEDLENV